ncbi:hypothetical protein J568_4494 [Acinetobacter baumannii 6112]|nr:hypothetical protein J568_4494 [Acinetobacter baumannii 6112]
MSPTPIISLYFASVLTFVAALLHFICVFWGANGFRFLGAGKSIVQMVEKGHWYPNFMAIAVGFILLVSIYNELKIYLLINIIFKNIVNYKNVYKKREQMLSFLYYL